MTTKKAQEARGPAVDEPAVGEPAVPEQTAFDDAAAAGSDAAATATAPATARDLGESLCAYAIRELKHARQCLSWRQSRLHRGVHQGRKSLRRVRATLALAGVAFGRSGVLIDRELQRICRSLSDLRDGQALVEAIDRLAASAAASGCEALLRSVRRMAIARRAELGRHAIGAGAEAGDNAVVLGMLLAGVATLPWAGVREGDVLRAFAGGERRAASACRRAVRSDDDDGWHRWRRRARRLSQQRRALDRSALQPPTTDEHGKEIAVLLGEVQDFSLLVEHCGAGSPFPPAERRRLRELAAGEVRRLRARLHGRVFPQHD